MIVNDKLLHKKTFWLCCTVETCMHVENNTYLFFNIYYDKEKYLKKERACASQGRISRFLEKNNVIKIKITANGFIFKNEKKN